MAAWYVTPNRTPVVWGTAVAGGVATTEIHRLVTVPGKPDGITYLWRAAGAPVSAADITAAQADTDPGAVPALPAAPTTRGIAVVAVANQAAYDALTVKDPNTLYVWA